VAIGNMADLALELGDHARARAQWEETLELFRELGDERKIVENLISLGYVASREGRRDEAEALLRQGLEYAGPLVDKELAIWCLEELAGLAASADEAERAGRLMGAVETLRDETGHVGQPDEQVRDALTAKVDEAHFAAALVTGREMTFEQAVAYALETQATSAAQSP
jgi:tetratricopeptide (TPR) repeat protein